MAIALVQTKAGNGGNYANTNAQTLTSSVTAGNLLLVAITAGAADTIDSLADNRSNTYTLIDSIAGTDRQTWLYYAANVASGSTTITVTFSAGQYPDSILIAREYSGLATSTPVDKTVKDSSTTNYVNSHSAGTTTETTQADELVVMVVGSSGSTTPVFTAGTGFGNLTTANGFDAYTYSAIADKTVSATGTQTGSFGSTEYVRSQSILTTLKAAVANTSIKDVIGTGIIAYLR